MLIFFFTRHKAHTTYTGSCDCSQPPAHCADICAASNKDELAISIVFTGKRAGGEGEVLITLAIVDSDGDGGVSETIASSSTTAVGADDVEIDAAVPVAGLADGTYELTISGGDVFGFRMQSKAMVDVKAAKNVGYVVTDKPIYKPGQCWDMGANVPAGPPARCSLKNTAAGSSAIHGRVQHLKIHSEYVFYLECLYL